MRSQRFNPGVLFLWAFLLLGCTARQDYRVSVNNLRTSPDAININTATVDELERLPHVGRKTAEAIVEFRTSNGPFTRPEHLMQIHGISESRYAEIAPLVKTE